LPWNAPSPEDVAAAFAAAGFGNIVAIMPWEAPPAGWPPGEAIVPEDAFVVRGGGVWTGGDVLPARIPLSGGRDAISVVQVWLHALPLSAEPLPPPVAPGAQQPGIPTSPSPPAAPRPPPSPAHRPSFTPEPLPPPRPPRGLGTGAKIALGGGAIAAATLLVAHAPFRRSRTA
jgi:hypothetical protein